MDMCENEVFLELRAKAVELLRKQNKNIGKCCTVDCIVGLIKKYYNDLAAHEMSELIEIMKELNDLDEIRDHELKDFYDNSLADIIALVSEDGRDI